MKKKRQYETDAYFQFKFGHIDANLTNEQLNEGYGGSGMFFPSLEQANAYHKQHKGSRITKILDGIGKDKYVKGYLVTTTEGGLWQRSY